MPSKKKIEDMMQRPLSRICNDAGPDGKHTEWHFDDSEKVYVRTLDGKPIRAIRGDSLIDPVSVESKRKDTLEAIIRHVSADKIEQVAGEAINRGADPAEAIFDHFRPKTKCSDAVHAMWEHWQTVKDK